MRRRFISLTNKQIKIYDADTTLKEVSFEFIINFIYAFVANICVPFIVKGYDIGVIFAFLFYYYFLSYILNRDKYETKFARYMLMPLPCALGAYVSYKIGYFLVDILL